jgi:L-fucose isomerase-like protein
VAPGARYEEGPVTVTRVPMGVNGQTMAAVATGISTHPLDWGEP